MAVDRFGGLGGLAEGAGNRVFGAVFQRRRQSQAGVGVGVGEEVDHVQSHPPLGDHQEATGESMPPDSRETARPLMPNGQAARPGLGVDVGGVVPHLDIR